MFQKQYLQKKVTPLSTNTISIITTVYPYRKIGLISLFPLNIWTLPTDSVIKRGPIPIKQWFTLKAFRSKPTNPPRQKGKKHEWSFRNRSEPSFPPKMSHPQSDMTQSALSDTWSLGTCSFISRVKFKASLAAFSVRFEWRPQKPRNG